MSGAVTVDPNLAQALFDELRARTLDPPGVTRAAFGPGEQIAHEMVKQVARDLGLVEAIDAAGNLYLTYPGRDPSLPQWVIGSHLDSVPHGGNYDGAAGVVAGLCAVKALIDSGVQPLRSITVIAIRAEESNWFPISYLGSKAAFGLLPAQALSLPRSDTGRSLHDHMKELGFDPDRVAAGSAHLQAERVHGFIELHIEQGPVLEGTGATVGLVTGIAGSFRYRAARCVGAWGHSGAVPRSMRHDAVFAMADLINALDAVWQRLESENRAATITFGELGTNPELHGFSKVPGEVSFCIDVRSQSAACLESLHEDLLRQIGVIAQRRGVRFELGERTGSNPAHLDAHLRTSIAAVAGGLGLNFVEMVSGAGHDTATFAAAGVPSALIFIRNQHGSHNPDEDMRMVDFVAAAELLAHRLALDDDH